MGIPGFKEHWTEPRPMPVEMTDTEIVEFISEYVIDMHILEGNNVFPALYMLKYKEGFMESGSCSGTTLREAVRRAAARVAEINS